MTGLLKSFNAKNNFRFKMSAITLQGIITGIMNDIGGTKH